jgi:hypothetical protein
MYLISGLMQLLESERRRRHKTYVHLLRNILDGHQQLRVNIINSRIQTSSSLILTTLSRIDT